MLPPPRMVGIQTLPSHNEMDMQDQKDDRTGKDIEIMQSVHCVSPVGAYLHLPFPSRICMALSNH